MTVCIDCWLSSHPFFPLGKFCTVQYIHHQITPKPLDQEVEFLWNPSCFSFPFIVSSPVTILSFFIHFSYWKPSLKPWCQALTCRRSSTYTTLRIPLFFLFHHKMLMVSLAFMMAFLHGLTFTSPCGPFQFLIPRTNFPAHGKATFLSTGIGLHSAVLQHVVFEPSLLTHPTMSSSLYVTPKIIPAFLSINSLLPWFWSTYCCSSDVFKVSSSWTSFWFYIINIISSRGPGEQRNNFSFP